MRPCQKAVNNIRKRAPGRLLGPGNDPQLGALRPANSNSRQYTTGPLSRVMERKCELTYCIISHLTSEAQQRPKVQTVGSVPRIIVLSHPQLKKRKIIQEEEHAPKFRVVVINK